MNLSEFRISTDSSEKLIKAINLLRIKSTKPTSINGFSSEFQKLGFHEDYIKIYQTAIKNSDYDYLFFDESFIQFSFTPSIGKSHPSARYAFYKNPQFHITYEEYLSKLRDSNLLIDSNEQIGELLKEEYEQYLSEQQLDSSSISIRYDLDYKNYDPQIHSTSHLHIGPSQNVRIPCNKIITPLQFTLFIIKHIYYDNWKTGLKTHKSKITHNLIKSKKVCKSLDEKYWSNIEELELFIS